MQKRKLISLVLLRKLLTAAIISITFLAFFTGHLHIPSSKDHKFNDKFPTVQNLQRTQEIAPPHLSKLPLSTSKLNRSRGDSDYVKLWKPPSNRGFLPCTKPTPNYTAPAESRGYLLVHTNGGLNQMRSGICDMVAVARIINATLVIPELDKRSFWQDTSNFSDVFDEEHFISSLANDVKIIKKLPIELVMVNETGMVKQQFRSWSGMDYYENEIAKLWEDHEVIRASKSDSRLANNNLPPDIQKLRCRACYEALRFSPRIEQIGKVYEDISTDWFLCFLSNTLPRPLCYFLFSICNTFFGSL